MQAGAEVEAVGEVTISRACWTLQSALFRAAPAKTEPQGAREAAQGLLTRVDEIRNLGAGVAASGRPVEIAGAVTWSLQGEDFFFLEDLTGGIKVRFRPGQMEAPQRYKYIKVEGVTYDAGFGPAVELRQFQDLGTLGPSPVREITYDQAITGREDGELVDMLGFYERTESKGAVRSIHFTTPGGDFVALLVSPITFAPTPGSLVRVTGVCEATVDGNGQISGIILRTPSLAEVEIERDAPADFYSLPLRSLRDLRQISASRDLTRVHVSGTVLQSDPGRLLYLEEGNAAILVLSDDTQPLAPGDRVEAVGILGSQGVRPLLREVVYRRLGSGVPPVPESVPDPSRLSVALDSRLVTVRGTLIDALPEPDRMRLTLQSGSTLFEAVLRGAPSPARSRSFSVSSILDVTGIYRVVYDDSRRPRGFQLQVRSLGDIAVIQKARIWTLERSLLATAVLAGCTILGLGWVFALQRRVRRQTGQIREQLERQARLESELQHAARLESLGVLAGGIAHDFNNLLTIIIGNVSLAMLDEGVMDLAGNLMGDIKKGATRAADLTQQLLTFAKGGSPQRSTVSLPDIVRSTTEFILSGSTARCEFDFPPDLWNASVDKDQTAQVIQNLVLNAVQAMPDGGVVSILMRNETIRAGFKAALSPGRYIRLTISDSGEG
jgi:signal transduction histidine kinase